MLRLSYSPRVFPHAALAFAFAAALAASPAFAGPGNVRFAANGASVDETAGTIELRVERYAGDDGAITVDFATADGGALDGADYTAAGGTLSWADGDDDDRTITVAILDDALAESAESFSVALSNTTGGAGIHPARGTIEVTIRASDGVNDCEHGPDCGAGRVEFDQGSFHALESSGLAVITVERERGSQGEVSIEYMTSDITAIAGLDYTASSGVLTWADGDDADKTFLVELVDDGVAEGAETVLLTLFNPTGGAELRPQHATSRLILTDNADSCEDGDGDGDGNSHGSVRFVESSFQVIEGQPNALITVERRGGHQGNVSVDYSAIAGSATADVDFTPVAGTLNWAHADGGERTFAVPILEDDLEETTEEVLLALANPTGGVVIADEGSALLEILDNDGSTEACADDGDTLCLLGDRFRAEITYRTPNVGAGGGRAVTLSDQSGLFWFFDPANAEMLVKVIDGCGVPGLDAYWIFYAATTNVDFTLSVTDTDTGVVKQYRNPLGRNAEPVQDVITFRSCPE